MVSVQWECTNSSSNHVFIFSLVQHNHDHDEQDNGEEEYLQQDEFDSEEVVDLGEGEPMEESDDDDMEGKSLAGGESPPY
jgi:hypothetical protein